MQSIAAFRRALAVLLALAATLAAAAAPPAPPVNPVEAARIAVTQFKIDGWQTEQGLPQNTVQAMYQSRDGALWIGTGGGLARFDGIRFTTFESIAAPDVGSRSVFGFMEDAQGWLWIGHTRGATRWRDGRFENVVGDDLMQGRRVWAFAQGRDGAVWMASENGLVRWKDGRATLLTEADGLPTRRLRTLDFDRDGTLWIGTTGGGLVAYAGGKFTVYGPGSGFPHREVRHLIADPAGGIWAATAGAGLVRFENGRARTWGVAQGLPTEQLTFLARDKAGALWIGTWGAGLVRMRGDRFDSISSAGGLAGDQIWAVHVDREGSVWAGTWHGGLNRLSPRAFVVFGKPEGLSGDNARTVLHARDGTTWVATAGGGASRFEGGAVRAYTTKQGLPSDEASGLYEDRDGAIWVATYTGGVARIRDGRVESFGLREGLPNVDVRALLRDRAGTLWAGTASGLARFDGRRFAAVREAGAPREGVVALFEDSAGALWAGTAGDGLFRYRDGAFTTFTRKDGLASNWILALHESPAGTLWIGTNGEGMTRLRDGRFTSIRQSDGLWDGVAQVILEDRDGAFWMTCNRGFYRVARAELEAFADGRKPSVASTGFGPGDALRSTTFAGNVQPAGAVDAQGHLWLPSLRGLVIVDPQRLPGTGEPPVPRIEELRVNGENEPADGTVELPPGAAVVAVRYAAGTLLDAERVRYRYRMEGLTPGWVDVGRTREASFPALPPGRYRFRVAASVDGRRWGEAPAPLAITVEPHLWQSAGFIALAALAAAAAVASLFQLRTLQLRRRGREMERLVATKTEELRIANEHLSQLSFADALTGLPNRRRLDDMLDSEWRRAQRLGVPLAVVIADIDAFKAYNDTLGHPEGDKCLVAVADVIRDYASRAGDFAARYGGEEFVVLLPGADLRAATAFAEGLRAACEAAAIPHPSSPIAPVVTVSLGVASRVPSREGSSASLIVAADAALYRAKNEGRNRVGLAPEEHFTLRP